ncbi:hypothetical protein N7492_006869 [Penicillium capsulatum]|uniref:Uncharacterized protein n=1 Tax=Penicillium capsulatum TaxID=69766 RepID=A0A9W9LK81_9EURO|nr:hypothetical protein N7492_006869 [Penicillium capsulatum]
MYPSLIKRPIRKPPPFHITRLSRASVHGKTEGTVKADEDFFATTSFPPDLDAPENSQRQEKIIETRVSPGHDDEGATERKADIYETTAGSE